MRTILALGVTALLFVPAAVSRAGHQQPSDGCLVVTDGNGVVVISGQGGLLGRVDQGTLTIEDLNPADTSKPKVFGYDTKQDLSKTKSQYSGVNNLRFRFSGGGPFHVVVEGIGIDLSAIGQGKALLNGADYRQNGGSYSADAASLCVNNVKAFPTAPTRVVLGTSG
jgi:hypothetical protein